MSLKWVGMAGAALVALAVNASAVSLPDRVDAGRETPISAARFGISIDGVQMASFSELAGISSTVDFIPSDEDPLLGRSVKAFSIVLRRPLNRDLTMSSWLEAAQAGVQAARKSCSLVMYDAEGAPVARYYLESAWPSKLEVGSLKAGSSEVLMETVTLTGEFLQRVSD